MVHFMPKYFSSLQARVGSFGGGICLMSNALLLSLAAFFCVGWNVVAQESDRPLSWKEPTKTYTAKPGEISARFTFNVRNFSDTDVLIDDVKPSCGCTVAILP